MEEAAGAWDCMEEATGTNDQTTRDSRHAWDQQGAARTKSKAPAPSRELEANPGWCGRGGQTRVTQIRKKVHVE
jgi:hypothetical protein